MAGVTSARVVTGGDVAAGQDVQTALLCALERGDVAAVQTCIAQLQYVNQLISAPPSMVRGFCLCGVCALFCMPALLYVSMSECELMSECESV